MPPTTHGHRTTQPHVPHYYGDIARILMLSGVGMAFVAVPFSTGFMHDAFIFAVIGAIVIVAFAALTNPLKSWVIVGDAILCGIAVLFFELDAFQNYNAGNLMTFVLYEAISLLFVIGFYFSIKTARAFLLHQVGKLDNLAEFQSDKHMRGTKVEEDPLEAEKSYKPDFLAD